MADYFRTIAARGITPNYVGVRIGQNGEAPLGTIYSFEHFEYTTVVAVKPLPGVWAPVVEYDFAHLEEVDIYA